MAYETPDHRKVINELVFTDQGPIISGVTTVSTSGRVLLSGTKLQLGMGTTWAEITSA